MVLIHTVQLNSNLTLIFDRSRVFTDFIRVSDRYLRVFASNSCGVMNLTRD